MSEITDQDLASIYSSLSSCSPLVRGLVERLRRVEGERDEFKECYRFATVSVNDAYDKAYAKGQRDFQERAAEVCEHQHDRARAQAAAARAYACAEAIRALPIKERPQ